MNLGIPDGCCPFDEEDRGHLPCPPWIEDDQTPVAVEEAAANEPELDPPHHVHDLWVVLGLGED